jgi:hypothetical protein
MLVAEDLGYSGKALEMKVSPLFPFSFKPVSLTIRRSRTTMLRVSCRVLLQPDSKQTNRPNEKEEKTLSRAVKRIHSLI